MCMVALPLKDFMCIPMNMDHQCQSWKELHIIIPSHTVPDYILS